MIFKHKFRTGFKDVGMTGLTTNKSIQANMVDAAGFHSELAGYGVTAMPTLIFFKDKQKYYKKVSDMKKLTNIYNKHKNKEDYIFL